MRAWQTRYIGTQDTDLLANTHPPPTTHTSCFPPYLTALPPFFTRNTVEETTERRSDGATGTKSSQVNNECNKRMQQRMQQTDATNECNKRMQQMNETNECNDACHNQQSTTNGANERRSANLLACQIDGPTYYYLLTSYCLLLHYLT